MSKDTFARDNPAYVLAIHHMEDMSDKDKDTLFQSLRCAFNMGKSSIKERMVRITFEDQDAMIDIESINPTLRETK